MARALKSKKTYQTRSKKQSKKVPDDLDTYKFGTEGCVRLSDYSSIVKKLRLATSKKRS